MYFVVVAYWIIFSMVSFALSSDNDTISYAKAQLWRTSLRNDTDRLFIEKLATNKAISIWRLLHKLADYLVRDQDKLKVAVALESRQLNYTVLIVDVHHKIKETSVDDIGDSGPIETALRIGNGMSWKMYPTIKFIEDYYNHLSTHYQYTAKVKVVGRSVEGKSIKMVSISDGNPLNDAMVIVAGIHSREWIGITSALYIIHNIVTRFDKLPDYMKNKDWHIIPLLNPDGYEYSYMKDRLWRKNRRKTGECYGVDLNRNFDFLFGKECDAGTENGKCTSTYCGDHAFSEPETKALRDAIGDLEKKPSVFMDIHAYGQHIIYPWSYPTSKPKPNPMQLQDIAVGIGQAIYNSTSNLYDHGTATELVYPAPGSAVDWAYAQGISLSYAIESRDQGYHGFLLPREHIEPTGKELLAAVTYIARALDSESYSQF